MIYSFHHIGALFINGSSFIMSEKRSDNRGRILRGGESQRQDGRYAYKYKDLNGDIKFSFRRLHRMYADTHFAPTWQRAV